MSGKQERRGIQSRAGKVSDDITRISADLFSCVINPNFRAEIFHFSLKTQGYVALLAGELGPQALERVADPHRPAAHRRLV